MKDVIYLLFQLLTTFAKLLRPGGSRMVIAENLILKQQLIIHSRSRQRAPNLSTQDRALLGFWSLFLNPRRIARSAIIIKPSTLLRFHNAMKKRKYRKLFSPGGGSKPGPKGPSKEIIDAIVEIKRRNPRFGCPRIAQEINLAFGLDLDKDSLWSREAGPVDLFRCESIVLKSHWVMVVMEQYTRRIIGFGVHAGNVNGPVLCRMFNEATSGHDSPIYLSSDNDPLFQYHRWRKYCRGLFELPIAA